MRAAAAAALLAGAALVAGAGCAEPERRDWNVVVLLVDTLRADHLGAYGYPRDTSPALDAFAAANVLFADHRSQSPCTFPSVNSILTSRSPRLFTGREPGRFDIPAGVPALAEILKARDYATLAVSASPIVRATPSHLNEHGGYGRGFHVFLERCMGRRAACVHTDAFTYLPLLRRPFFLYLHYMDTHAPYQQPDFYEKRFFAGADGKKWLREGDPKPLERLVAEGAADQIDPADVSILIDLYDDSIGFFDQQFALLLETLARENALDDTLIAVIADHGESFLEHGKLLHCRTLYEPEVRVPWLMRVPGVEGPVRVEGPTANLDVVPTILDLLGEDVAGYEFEGRSHRRAIERGEPVGEATVFAEWGTLGSATDGRFKLVADRKAETVALYDLAADPGEERDLAAERTADVRRLASELEAWRRAAAQDGAEEEGESVEEQLKALGYLQ